MVKKYTPEELTKLLELDKLDELEFATKELSSEQIRTKLSMGLDKHLADNYDMGIESAIKKAKQLNSRPLLQRAAANAYEEAPELNLSAIYESKIDKPIKLGLYNREGDDLGFMDTGKLDTPTVNINEAYLEKVGPRGVALHEGDHIRDALKNKFIPDDELKIMEMVGKKGLKSAEETFGKHHKRGFFELEALKRLTQNKKLLGSLPIIGKGIAMSQILDSGDIFAAEPTGLVQSDTVGEGSDEIPDIGKRDVYNAKMKKTRKLMGDK